MAPNSSTLGTQGVCHLLSDAAQGREPRLRREQAVRWALEFGLLVSRQSKASTTDPEGALEMFLVESGVIDDVESRAALPGTPCETCIATQIVPMYAVQEVVRIARRLDCDPAEAFRWASRIGAIVMSSESTAGAANATDALSSFVLSNYASRKRKLRCDLAENAA